MKDRKMNLGADNMDKASHNNYNPYSMVFSFLHSKYNCLVNKYWKVPPYIILPCLLFFSQQH